MIEEDTCLDIPKDEISLDDIKEFENYPTMDVPYITICFARCDRNNGWENYNIAHSCEVAPSGQSYDNKVTNLIEQSNALLERLVQHHPDAEFTCSGYEMEGKVDQQDYAPWLCDKLNPIIGFVDKLDCSEE